MAESRVSIIHLVSRSMANTAPATPYMVTRAAGSRIWHCSKAGATPATGSCKPLALAHKFHDMGKTAQAPGAFLARLRCLSKTHQFFVSSASGNGLRPSGCDFSIVAYGRRPVTHARELCRYLPKVFRFTGRVNRFLRRAV